MSTLNLWRSLQNMKFLEFGFVVSFVSLQYHLLEKAVRIQMAVNDKTAVLLPEKQPGRFLPHVPAVPALIPVTLFPDRLRLNCQQKWEYTTPLQVAGRSDRPEWY